MLKLVKFHCTVKSVSSSDECVGCAVVVRVGPYSVVVSTGKQLCSNLDLDENILSHSIYILVVLFEVVYMFHVIHLDR